MNRKEDRRSCHATSFILGLAIAAKNREWLAIASDRMMMLVTPVPNQKPN